MDNICGKLERFGMVKRNQNARFVSPAYVVPKIAFPKVQEYLHGAKFFIGLDLKDGYFQCPLDISCQELYSFAAHRAVYTPTRVTQGSSGAVLYFQAKLFGVCCIRFLSSG